MLTLKLFPIIQVIGLTVGAPSQGASPLVSHPGVAYSIDQQACCKDQYLKTCFGVDVAPEVLASKSDVDIFGSTLSFKNMATEHSYVYQSSQGDEAIFHYTGQGSLLGSLHSSTGKSYFFKKCGSIYVAEEFNVAAMPDTETVIGDDTGSVARSSSSNNPYHVASDCSSAEVVTFSVMFYYTPEFAAITEDIPGFFDLVVAETNQGYINSDIPVRVKIHCLEQTTWSESEDPDNGFFLYYFEQSKGTTEALRNTADAASLFVTYSPFYCGVAYLGTYNSALANGRTVSVNVKSCALGRYVVGHEFGHNFGAHHNVEIVNNNPVAYAHGHRVDKGTQSLGFSTVLAYNTAEYPYRINYYSDPSKTYSVSGTPLGVEGVSNNVRLITENRMIMANLGDESGQCASSGPATKGIIVTGGDPKGNRLTSTELLMTDGSQWCTLPNLDTARYLHSQDGLTACGGPDDTYAARTCVTLEGGAWTNQMQLKKQRFKHTSWKRPDNQIFLLGGFPDRFPPSTAEILSLNSKSSSLIANEVPASSSECAIHLEDKLILTGYKTVAEYNENGFVKNLPAHNDNRYDHSCGHFVNSDNKVVYLVFGGTNGIDTEWQSTEMFVEGDSAWSYAGNLPPYVGRAGSAVSFDNRVIYSGGAWWGSNNVNEFDIETKQWKEIGKLQVGRFHHRMDVIEVTDDFLEENCQ